MQICLFAEWVLKSCDLFYSASLMILGCCVLRDWVMFDREAGFVFDDGIMAVIHMSRDVI